MKAKMEEERRLEEEKMQKALEDDEREQEEARLKFEEDEDDRINDMILGEKRHLKVNGKAVPSIHPNLAASSSDRHA